MDISSLPAVNAMLNGTSAVLLVIGYYYIRRGRFRAHGVAMAAASVASAAFLTFYLIYHYHVGEVSTRNMGLPTWLRTIYLLILATHVILAAVNLPMIILTLIRAWRRKWEAHRRIARWTLPIWLYVSVTGVGIYWMLYHLFPGMRG